MAVEIIGGASAVKANVNSDLELLVQPTKTKANIGLVGLAGQNDAGTITGSKDVILPRVSEDFNLQVGVGTPLFEDRFNSVIQNTSIWKFFSLNSLIGTGASGFFNLNPTQVVTTGGVVALSTWRHIPIWTNAGLLLEFDMNFSGVVITPLAGQVIEFGLFVPPATAVAPPDGVFFRYTSAGLNGIMVNNSGSETQITTPRACSNFTIDTGFRAKMIITDKICRFYVNDVEIGNFNIPAGFTEPFLSGALPIAMIARNTGTIASVNGTYARFGAVTAKTLDVDTGKSLPTIMASMGKHVAITPNGTAFGTTGTSNSSNSQAIGTAAALTNTAIGAVPAVAGLGGQATYLPTLTAFTDGLLMSYQNVTGTVNIQPRTLYITGIRINSAVSAALTGGAVHMMYSAAWGHTAASLATTESASFTTAATKLPKKMFIGAENFPITAAIGAVVTGGVNVTFETPIVVNPAEFFAIVAKNVGIVTTVGSITSLIGIEGFWE
jgi:hypothetical protein